VVGLTPEKPAPEKPAPEKPAPEKPGALQETPKVGPEQTYLDWLQQFSTELSDRDENAVENLREMLTPGQRVYIPSLPRDDPETQLNTAIKLMENGLCPVPHLVARKIKNRLALEHHVRQLVHIADVRRVLVIAGDQAVPAGEFLDSPSLIKTGILSANGIEHVDVGCHPEGHPGVADEVLWRFLHEKVEAIETGGAQAGLVSQFCFNAKPLLDFVEKLRSRDINTPLSVGVAGINSPMALIRFARLCGVGASVKHLKSRPNVARTLVRKVTPEVLLKDLARAVAENSSLRLSGIHIYAFGGLKETYDWLLKQKGEA